jgi:hypothetical protein
MPNRNRDVTMVVSGSSRNEFLSLHYGLWGPAGGGTVDVLKQGEGPHLKCRQLRPCDKPTAVNGWGDYNTAALDPTDETTVWLYGAAGANKDRTTWATWIASVP